MSNSARVLAVEDLAIGYRGRPVGEGLSFSVHTGEILALLGPNGSGKTTLFKTLLGLIARVSGRVLVDGAEVSNISLSRRAQLFGYVPQSSAGFFPYSVREIVLMGRTPHVGTLSTPTTRDREHAEAAIERLGLAGLADRDFTRISGGERQLVLIARALAQAPAFLVMDEPTANLDFGNQLRTLDLVRALASDGLGIVFSTHHPDQALAVASHAALMKAGRLQICGKATDVLTGERLSALFGVRLSVERAASALVCVPGPSV